MKRAWIWGVILALTVLITFWKLGAIPSGFYWDEAALGYDGWSLLKTGADEYGVKWPMYFKSAGDYKYPAYSYLTMIPVAIMGLSIFSARFIAALSGVVSIFFIFKIVDDLNWFKDKSKWWLVLGSLLAICSPWYLLFARTAREATLGMALMVTGFWAITKYFNDKKNKWLVMIGICFATAGLSYSALRLFLILLMLGLVFIWKRNNKYLLFVFGVVAMILIGLTLDPGSRLRAENTLNLINGDTVRTAQKEVFEVGLALPGKVGIPLARVFDNKIVVKSREWVYTYLRHFDLSYLFADANPNLPWYHAPDIGLLLLISAPLFFIGLFELGKRWKESWIYPALLWWLLIAEAAPALTIETPNPIRQLTAFPAFILIIILGLSKVISWGGKLFKVVIIFLVLVNCVYGLKQFFIHREYHIPYYTNQGFRQVVDYIGVHQNEYKSIELPEDPYIFFLFWGQKYGWKNTDLKLIDRQWGSVASLQNINFLAPENCPKEGVEGVLYLCMGNKIPRGSVLKLLVRFNDGEPEYNLIEFPKMIKGAKLPILPDRLNYQ